MKKNYWKLIILVFSISLFSFKGKEGKENVNYQSGKCEVVISYYNSETGRFVSERYVSYGRVSQADCEQGARDIANGNFLATSDFRLSYQMFDWEIQE